MNLVLKVVVNALALGAAAWLVEGIRVTGATTGEDVLTLLGVGAVFGVVNAFVAPLVKLVSLPFIVLTLGLLLVVINALMLLLTEVIADAIGLDFAVDGFWPALWGAIIISVISIILPSFDD